MKNIALKDLKPKELLAGLWSKYSFIFVFFLILLLYVITVTVNGNVFSWNHISALLASQNTVIVGLIALGMALVIITGQIDLSVGSNLVLTTGAAVLVYNVTDSILMMVLAAIAVGAFCGLINGVLVGYAKMPPFIVTLGTMLIYRSITLSCVRLFSPEITGSTSSQFSMLRDNSTYEFLRLKFGTGNLDIGSFRMPYITMLFIVILVIVMIIATKTKYGKKVYAIGSNEKASFLVGININAMKMSVFVVTGILVGLASFVQACKIGSVTPASTAKSYEMYAIAAVVLGGINMAGGRGNILGVFFGTLSYTTINSIIMNIPGLSVDIQDTFQGLVLIVVIIIQTIGPVIKERFVAFRRQRQSLKPART